jgi:DNA repair protein RecN (Recombination protein N)
MLCELAVEGVGVIDRAELSLDPGSSALTGETGAGKTLLVAALGLLLGDRADRAIVRSGAAEARVEGRFEVPRAHPAVEVLETHGLLEDSTEDVVEVVVARTVAADGRGGKVRINGRIGTVAVLSALGPALVEIAGQHEHQRIGAPAWQRSALDAFAGPGALELADRVKDEVAAAARARAVLEAHGASERERHRELDVLRYEISDIEGAALHAGEEARLLEDARRLEHAESIAVGLDRAVASLADDGAAVELVGAARAEVAALVDADPGLADAAARLEAATYELADVAHELTALVPSADPAVLAGAQERLAVISRLKRKYGDDEASVLSYLERATARADELEAAEESTETLAAHARELEDAAEASARDLSALRRDAAPGLERQVTELLNELALPSARFEVSFEVRDLYEGGNETIRFLVSANEGMEPRLVTKVASGGELSRIALALHLVTARSVAPTMIFDEVDAGVGGLAARAVGRCLAQLARRTGTQVVVVTHLPQVAAFADSHHLVSKEPKKGATVRRIEGAARVEELSRMLAGLPDSERAREHAEELLELAASAVAG